MKREISDLVINALNGYVAVLPLRGADNFMREGGDLDFMVIPGMSILACKLVSKAAIDIGWHVGGFRDIGYLAQLILFCPVENGKDVAIKIDFFDGLRWYGVGDNSAAIRLFDIFTQSNINESKIAGAAGFFQKLLTVGQLSSRDFARVTAMGADEVYLAEVAKSIGLSLSIEQVCRHEVVGLEKWRLRASSGGVTNLLSAFVWFARVSWAHLKFKLGFGTKAGFTLSISGMDGSGKSTLVDRLLAAYSRAGGNQPILLHFLPPWMPQPHQIFRRKKTSKNYTRPYFEAPVASKISGFLRLAYYFFAFAITRFSLSVATIRGKQIIQDRSFVDFVSDLTRARIPQVKLPSWLLSFLVPPGKLFYLEASPEAVVARKGELTLKKACCLQKNYGVTCQITDMTILNGNNTPYEIFRELLGHISCEYMLRIEIAETHNRRY